MTDDEFRFDVRVRERFVRRGQVTADDVQSLLDGLPDLEGAYDSIELRQPAIGREPEPAEEPLLPFAGSPAARGDLPPPPPPPPAPPPSMDPAPPAFGGGLGSSSFGESTPSNEASDDGWDAAPSPDNASTASESAEPTGGVPGFGSGSDDPAGGNP